MRTSLSKRFLVGLMVAASAMGAGSSLGAGEEEDHFEIGVQGGVFLPDRLLSGKPETFEQIEPMVGLRGGYLFADRFGWFFDAAQGQLNTNATFSGDVDILTARTGIEFFSRKHWKQAHWFFAVGYGFADYDLEKETVFTDFDRGFLSASFGQRWALDHRARLRWELRGDRTVDDDGFGRQEISTLRYLIAVTWGLGVGRPDTDGDGVPDGRDDCPGTPRGATVDARGCPSDSDGDGVYDGIDECPGTPPGATVDAKGCPGDRDGDGVYDGIDQCPNTPRGATVDARGCPSDSDGDGVYDGIDQCPNTPRGAKVDAKGCSADSDGDGVPDGIDRCPNTPRGAIVDARGCPLDSDGDGVFDGIDQCPNTPPGTAVNPDGCPTTVPLVTEERPVMILEGVFFELNKAVLTANSRTTLDMVAQSLRDWPEISVEIGGHSDSTGTDSYNLDLSSRRAVAVRDYLRGQGVSADRLRARGYGESDPIADNTTKQGRAKNRRVELKKLN